jgi:hypothetical protein
VHNIDLTGRDMPWQAIGQLDALEELSLWNCGLGGPIEASAVCRLRGLRVLAMSQNALRGTVPECIAGLALVFNTLLPTPPLRMAGPRLKSEGVSKVLRSAEFAGHAWTAFNMGWSETDTKPPPSCNDATL